MTALDVWAASVDGKRLDVDGAFPGECHDVFLSRLVSLGGAVTDGHAPGVGYTNAVWHQFPSYRPGLAKLFTKHGAQTIKRGDVVFWDSYAGVGGLPHVAVALADAGPNTVYCMTQNPGVTHREHLTRAGIVGVLRPKTQEDPVTEAEMKQIAAFVLDTPIKHEGTDAKGKPRTGYTSLRAHVGWANYQTGITRRLVERIDTTTRANGKTLTALNKTVTALNSTVSAVKTKLGA